MESGPKPLDNSDEIQKWEKDLRQRVNGSPDSPISTTKDVTFSIGYEAEVAANLEEFSKPKLPRAHSFPLKGRDGRYHIVSAERQKKLIGTIRPAKQPKTDTPPKKAPRPQPAPQQIPKDKKPRYATSPDAVADLVLQSASLQRLHHLPSGLLLISGRTGAAKTKLAASLIAQLTKYARPHAQEKHVLITAEDPAEIVTELDGYFHTEKGKPLPVGIRANETFSERFFPIERDLNFDGSLNLILLDALRQSPSVVYIGELRRHHDFEHAFNFARTGHLVIATFHAGSLRGAFEVLFERLKKRSIQDRAIIADTLLGLVYMQKLHSHPSSMEKNWEMLCPSCWWSQATTRKTLSAHGLGAIMFDDPGEENPAIPGHTWFAQKILIKGNSKASSPMEPEARDNLLRAAVTTDIEQS